MDKRTFKKLMVLFDAETVEILGDAKFAVEVVTEQLTQTLEREGSSKFPSLPCGWSF